MSSILSLPMLAQNNDDKYLNLVSGIVGGLSIMGCIFNIVVTRLLGKSQIIIGKMVIILAIFDILNHLPWVLIDILPMSPASCQILSSITFFGFASSLFFTTCFAHSLYHSLKNGNVVCIKESFKSYLAFSLIPGLVSGALAIGLQVMKYDSAQSTCINPYPDGFNWGSLLLLLIPGTLNILGCTFYYILTIRALRSLNEEWHWGLLVYPLILVICLFPSMIRRYFQLFGEEIWIGYVAWSITRGLFEAQGFLNSLAYGLSKEIYNSLKSYCCRSRSEVLTDSFSSTESVYHSNARDKAVTY